MATAFVLSEPLQEHLNFLKQFQQQFIVCQHLLCPIILGQDFYHNYLIGIDWFLAKQLCLHQGPQSIVVSDPASFPLYVNQICILPLPHILVKNLTSHNAFKDISNSSFNVQQYT